MVTDKINKLLTNREFISVATCDFSGRPNVAPKFFLKLENKFIYLIDYVLGTSYENIKLNPRVSISLMDLDNLIGYQMNGAIEIIERGKEHDQLLAEFQEKEVSLSTKRIIQAIDTGKTHQNFEVSLPEQAIIFKVKIEEIVVISSNGNITREKIQHGNT